MQPKGLTNEGETVPLKASRGLRTSFFYKAPVMELVDMRVLGTRA